MKYLVLLATTLAASAAQANSSYFASTGVSQQSAGVHNGGGEIGGGGYYDPVHSEASFPVEALGVIGGDAAATADFAKLGARATLLSSPAAYTALSPQEIAALGLSQSLTYPDGYTLLDTRVSAAAYSHDVGTASMTKLNATTNFWIDSTVGLDQPLDAARIDDFVTTYQAVNGFHPDSAGIEYLFLGATVASSRLGVRVYDAAVCSQYVFHCGSELELSTSV